jgi:hypothetical protein
MSFPTTKSFFLTMTYSFAATVRTFDAMTWNFGKMTGDNDA